MSWCDKLASTPTVGFTLDTHFANTATILEAFAPILDRHVDRNRADFEIEVVDNFGVNINTNAGFRYGVDQRRSSVTFIHRMRPKYISGGPPIMEMLSRPLPYTELLSEVTKRAIEAALLLPKNKERTVSRVGIVSNTQVDEHDMPPGIVKLIEHFGRPWNKLTEAFTIQIGADLGKVPGAKDRCVHTLARTDDPKELLTLQFDFQRTFENPKVVKRDSLEDITAQTEKAALRYFEDVAQGDRFDEINDSNSANV